MFLLEQALRNDFPRLQISSDKNINFHFQIIIDNVGRFSEGTQELLEDPSLESQDSGCVFMRHSASDEGRAIEQRELFVCRHGPSGARPPSGEASRAERECLRKRRVPGEYDVTESR